MSLKGHMEAMSDEQLLIMLKANRDVREACVNRAERFTDIVEQMENEARARGLEV